MFTNNNNISTIYGFTQNFAGARHCTAPHYTAPQYSAPHYSAHSALCNSPHPAPAHLAPTGTSHRSAAARTPRAEELETFLVEDMKGVVRMEEGWALSLPRADRAQRLLGRREPGGPGAMGVQVEGRRGLVEGRKGSLPILTSYRSLGEQGDAGDGTRYAPPFHAPTLPCSSLLTQTSLPFLLILPPSPSLDSPSVPPLLLATPFKKQVCRASTVLPRSPIPRLLLQETPSVCRGSLQGSSCAYTCNIGSALSRHLHHHHGTLINTA